MKQDKDYELPAPGALSVRQAVELEVLSETELGYKALVDDRYIGLLYHSELPQPLEIGQYLKGWVKGVRDDGKIDLTITALDDESRDALDAAILNYLVSKGGVAALSDKTDPERIHALFATSKSSFKRALGRLKKSGQIVIGKTEIRTAGEQVKPFSPWARKPRA
ncbi:MAG TPA: hypothetical protein GX696_05630 [Pseudomonadaceae bacterium]|nr:hypothetical protein [Pseudomonadaceae bacterium]